ncbi:MAG TPA: efflux RND transporter permease subunit, partial [Steroidobacteraceae bacterium]|nr:efflux RND transporter permease subunit [Steroidobacteraceae bacterium]
VSIETDYLGASADVVETKITQVIEDRVAGIEGITKITSESSDGRSSINLEFAPERDVDEAANDVRDRVSRLAGNLPEEADPPEIGKVDFNAESIIYLNLASDTLNVLELTDYGERVLVERLGVLPGVARVRLNGARRYAMRVWLDREALAARRLTVADVEAALRRENVQLPAGRLESSQREFTLRTDTGLATEQEFRQLAVGRGPDGYLVRLDEVADVRLAAENERSVSRSNGVPGISVAVEQISKANTLEVAQHVRDEVERLRPDLPPGTRLEVNLDRSVFIEESMKEVLVALVIALVLVLIVIYLFLGNVRATLIPALTIPVSIIAAFLVMAAMGFSINVLTLLGLVLAIGLVVDDSIVVLENIYRRMEGGEPPLIAAVDGSREIGFAVIATTAVLVAVFVPMSFLEGAVGKLFREFGFTIAAAVLFSALIALTLTPMLASRFLGRESKNHGRVYLAIEWLFDALVRGYTRGLDLALRHRFITLMSFFATMALTAVLFVMIPKGFFPTQDNGLVTGIMEAAQDVSPTEMKRLQRQVAELLSKDPDI